MKKNLFFCVMALALLLPACGKNEEKKPTTTLEEVNPDRGTVDLGGDAQDRKAANGAPRGYAPDKWDKLPEATKKVIERENALTQKRKQNPDITDKEILKSTRGSEPQKEYKF